MTQLPPGWALHPQNPQYAYDLSNPQNMQLVTALAPPAAPAAPANEFSDDPLSSYVSPDTKEVLERNDALDRNARGWEAKGASVYLDFAKKSGEMEVNEECYLNVRPLANLSAPEEYMVIERRHRIFADYIPEAIAGNRQIMYVPCPNQPAFGNQACKICEAEARVTLEGSTAAQKHVENMQARVRYVWQVIDMDDPASHWTPDPSVAGGYSITPKILGITKTMQRDFDAIRRRVGDFCHPYNGYQLRLTKRKESADSFGVKYSATETLGPGPIREDLIAVQVNGFDLTQKVLLDHALAPEVIEAIGDAIIRKQLGAHAVQGNAGLPPGGPWVPHPQSPGWEYQPSTGQMRQSAAPVAAPVAAPPVIAAPPVAPPPVAAPPVAAAMPPMPPAPQAMPPAMPPMPPAQQAMPPAPPAAPPGAPGLAFPPPGAPGLHGGAPPPVASLPPGLATPPPNLAPVGAAGAPGQVPGMPMPPVVAPPAAPPAPAQSPAAFEQAALNLPPPPVLVDGDIPF